MRNFETGATRDSDENKYDYEAFLSPLVLERYGQYMHSHRKQADGTLRDGDNWQKGIPKNAYMKSAWRHFMDLWKEHRGIPTEYGLEESLTALMFNIMGYLHETIKERQATQEDRGGCMADFPIMNSSPWDTKSNIFDIAERAMDIEIGTEGHFTHRYGALAHDQESIDAEDKITAEETSEKPRSPLPRTYSYTEEDPAFPGYTLAPEHIAPGYYFVHPNGALVGPYETEERKFEAAREAWRYYSASATMAGVVHSKVLGISPERPASEVAEVAPEVRSDGGCQTPIIGCCWY